MAAQCPNANQDRENLLIGGIGGITENKMMNAKYFKEAKINGKNINSYIDTGSKCVTLREADANILGLEYEVMKSPFQLTGYGSGKVTPLGECNALVEVDQAEAHVTICNMSKEMLTIEAGQKLGRGYLCVEDQVETDTGSMLAASTSRVQKIMDECHLGARLSEDDVGQLRNLIEEYHDCFALSIGELGCVNHYEMKLQLTTDEPITHRPYRLSYAERMRVLKQIEELKAAGIVEESISEYASPIVIVKKKNGEERICVD
ncbi:hypothetical protein QE152_g15651 [Popillia japonica]|uniref:Uncharacterized protein n=1 Tax=Popillia japonica TaxID=7064 RepID=A0AAW1L7F3_POPJA